MPFILDTEQFQKYTYQKSRNIVYSLDDADLETRCPLDNGRHATQSRHSVGQLDELPLELVTEILLMLDLPTLTAFRRVNSRAISLVDSIYQYRMIRKHCPNILRAIISINAQSFNCWALYRTLSTTKCATCDRFGGYLYLITCKRVCYSCFKSNLNYFPVTSRYATQRTGLKRKELKRLPHISSLPGRYSISGRLVRNRTLLFDRQSVVVKSLRQGPVHTPPVERPQLLDRTTTEPRRYMSIISAPHLTSSGQSAEWGYFCTRCIDNLDPATHFRIKYTKVGILEHLKRHRVELSMNPNSLL
ncbi:hypothetical protein EV127DRAFT_448302 [Xylaria flabelliformis]|nr:hypothetical protein EV127DRAFT_448302 [Xylaria flabelliformis]